MQYTNPVTHSTCKQHTNTLTHPTANAMLGAATGTLTVYMNTFLCPSLVNNYTDNTIQSHTVYMVYLAVWQIL